MSTLSTSKILVCIYTCENDVDSLNKLKETGWYKKYSQYNNITIIDVYADENINQEYNYKNNELTVKTEESNTNLSIKTYKMIETCINLLKAGHDVSVVQFGNSNKKFLFNNIPITQIKVPKLLFLQRLGFIRRWTWAGLYFIKALDKKADWIHLHNHHFSFPLPLPRLAQPLR